MTTCAESVPSGATKPVLRDSFPDHGTSGHAATLHVEIEHGRGEAVLSPGMQTSTSERTQTDLKTAGFAFPDQDAGAAARLGEPTADSTRPERSHTVLELPLVPLPVKPGRALLELPPFPISVSRASGEIMTVCTTLHRITVEDPIANVADAKPQLNPPPLPQHEDWMAARIAAIALALAIVVAAIAAYFAYRYAKRAKPPPPPKPRLPPWETALAKLAELRGSGLLERGQRREYVDSVSDVLREYLGARYGFDGIESTTDEIRHALARQQLGSVSLPHVLEFLEASDLVKFAKVSPPVEDCSRMHGVAEAIVRGTIIHGLPAQAPGVNP